MKLFTLITLFISLTSTGFSQINQGNFLVGGTISFESLKNENSVNGRNESSNFYVSPNIGYFIFNKLAGGLRVDFGSYNSKSANLETQYNSTSLSPFIRYYFLPKLQKVNAFIDAGYIHQKTKWSSDTNDGYYEKANGYSFSAGPAIFLTENIALEFIVGFKHTKSDNFGNTKLNTFNSGLGLQIHL